MKRFGILLCILSLLCLFFTRPAFTQPGEADMKRIRTQQKLMAGMMKSMIASSADGSMLARWFTEYGDDKDFQAFAGTTQQQFDEYDRFAVDLIESKVRPYMKEVMEQANKEEDQAKIAALSKEAGEFLHSVQSECTKKLREILSPQQIRKLQEVQMKTVKPTLSKGVPIIDYDVYAVLDLSYEQGRELESIREEQLKEQQVFLEDSISKLMANLSSPMKERVEIEKQLEDQGAKLVARIQSRIVGILTPAQLKRLGEIYSDIPEFVKAKQKERNIPQQIDAQKYSDWKNNWKPGDPIPEEFKRIEKSRRKVFPMAE